MCVCVCIYVCVVFVHRVYLYTVCCKGERSSIIIRVCLRERECVREREGIIIWRNICHTFHHS